MSGILDSKTRILDALLTAEGRRQLAEGTFTVSYATFSDADVSYEPDVNEGHVDPTDRIHIEASNLPQDQIVYEANDAGNLVPLRSNNVLLDLETANLSLLPRNIASTFVDGKAVASQINFGPRVKVNTTIPSSFKETGVGFSYTDSNGNLAKVILDSNSTAGQGTISGNQISIGVKGGINLNELTTRIQEQVLIFSASTGPKVTAVDRQNFIYFTDDFAGKDQDIVIKLLTGSMSSTTSSVPFTVEEAVLGGRLDTVDLPNAVFVSNIEGILTSSFDNFSELKSISTIDPIFAEEQFELSTNEITFDISRLGTKNQTLTTVPSLNSIDSIFNDDKLSSALNFRYLPPIVKTSETVLPDKTDLEATLPYRLGDYPPIGDNKQSLSYQDIREQVNQGIGENVGFVQTTRYNNLLCQIFEVSNNTVTKLDIVDYGDVRDLTNSQMQFVKNKVYFVGKTYEDDRGTTCYVNIFTIIFSQNSGDEE